MGHHLLPPFLETTVVFIASLHLISGTVYTVEKTTTNSTYLPVLPPANFNISTMSRLNFSVQICRGAHVLLSEDPKGGQNLYEIVIGDKGNTKSNIREAKQGCKIVQENHSPVNCDEFRKFFVSWEDDVLRVGSVEGDVKQPVERVFLEYRDQTPFHVRYLFVAGGDGPGEWRFEFTDFSDTPTASPVECSQTGEATTSLSTRTTDVMCSKMTSTFTLVTSGISNEVTTSSDISSPETYVSKRARPSGTPVQPPTQQSAPCTCHCVFWNASGIEPQDPAEVVSQLLVPTNSTSAARRRRTSATDDRPSSIAIGVFGVACLLCPVIFLVYFDLAAYFNKKENMKPETNNFGS